MSDLLDQFEQLELREQQQADQNPYSPPELLWDQLRAQIKPAEEDGIKGEIGEELIDHNQLLRDEAMSLADILHMFQSKNQAARNKLKSYLKLTEKREHKVLKEQIQRYMMCLVKHLKETGKEHEVKAIVNPTSSAQQTAVQYSLEGIDSPSLESSLASTSSPLSSRPSTARSLQPSTARSSRPSTSICHRIALEQQRFDIWSVGQVVYDIREALIEERQDLQADLRSLKDCLEDETRFHVDVKSGNVQVLPSVEDLERLGTKIKTKLDQETQTHCKTTRRQKRDAAPRRHMYKTRNSSHPSLNGKPLALGPLKKSITHAKSSSTRSKPSGKITRASATLRSAPHSPSVSTREECRLALTKLLKQYNPSKLKNVEMLLDMYKGKEHDLLRNVRIKYAGLGALKNKKAFPPSPSATRSRVERPSSSRLRSRLAGAIADARSFLASSNNR